MSFQSEIKSISSQFLNDSHLNGSNHQFEKMEVGLKLKVTMKGSLQNLASV